MEDKYLEIIRQKGIRNQAKHFMSECVELFEVITEYETADDINFSVYKNEMEQETADVLNFIEQFILHYNLDRNKIKEIQEFKTDRTLYETKNNIKKENRKEE